MTESIRVDALPTRTWAHLGVNDAEVDWDGAAAVLLSDTAVTAQAGETKAPVRLTLTSGAPYGRHDVTVRAAENSRVDLVLCQTAAQPLHVRVHVEAAAGAAVRVLRLLQPKDGATMRCELSADCAEAAALNVMSVLLGDGDIYDDQRIRLHGAGSRLTADTAYLARRQDTVDYSICVEQTAPNTESAIDVRGALFDAAKKTFRGTIDFQKGSTGSVGTEQETVLMLGDDVQNRSVPLILCAEEEVDGSHGATIGTPDPQALFYFASRGIDAEKAQRILARAAVERLTNAAQDEAFTAAVLAALHEGTTEEADA